MSDKPYTYSVIQKDGRENPRKKGTADDHTLVALPSAKTPIQMRGETIVAEAPANGVYQIRVDGPGGTEFFPWEEFKAGQAILFPKDKKVGV